MELPKTKSKILIFRWDENPNFMVYVVIPMVYQCISFRFFGGKALYRVQNYFCFLSSFKNPTYSSFKVQRLIWEDGRGNCIAPL